MGPRGVLSGFLCLPCLLSKKIGSQQTAPGTLPANSFPYFIQICVSTSPSLEQLESHLFWAFLGPQNFPSVFLFSYHPGQQGIFSCHSLARPSSSNQNSKPTQRHSVGLKGAREPLSLKACVFWRLLHSVYLQGRQEDICSSRLTN